MINSDNLVKEEDEETDKENIKSAKGQKGQQVQSDQFAPICADVNIDCAKNEKYDSIINVFPDTLVKENSVTNCFLENEDQSDSELNINSNLERIRNTELNICDIETISEQTKDAQYFNFNEQDNLNKRKDTIILQGKYCNWTEEYSAAKMIVDCHFGNDGNIPDNEVSESKNAIPNNIDEMKMDGQI